MPTADEIAAAVRAGDVRMSARVMRDLDDARPSAVEVMKRLYPHTGRAYVLGITGNPGAGKSTVVDALIDYYRKLGKRVGVVAVDPSSPFSGGAILGDRIRMQRHATDEGVFIRSLATRGHLGGLSRSTGEVAAVLDAMGYDIVMIETVGVGQDEVDVVSQAECAIVVTVPGLGDEIQAIKAGVLEIADIHVVSKADRSDAARTVADLKNMLHLAISLDAGKAWHPPVIPLSSVKREGFDELIAALDQHKVFLDGSDAGHRRIRQIAEFRALKTAEELLRQRFRASSAARLPAVASRLASREISPYAAGEELLR